MSPEIPPAMATEEPAPAEPPPAEPPPPATREALEAQHANNAGLRSLILTDGHYDGIVLQNARFDGMDLRRAIFQDANLVGASLVGVNAVRATFTKAKLGGADLRTGDFTDAQFNSADLSHADVRGCWFSPDTNFNGATVTGLKIDRRALRMLGNDHAGMTAADLAELQIEDDQVKLTTHFGGFWTVLHLMAVTIFVLPYVIFSIRRYVTAQILPCAPPHCTSLREALWDYIVTGGTNDSLDLRAIVLFFLLLLYNVFRASLVFKARSLKLAEEAAGIPRQFVLSGYWKAAYYGCQWLVWVNLSLVLWHAYHFLGTPVRQ